MFKEKLATTLNKNKNIFIPVLFFILIFLIYGKTMSGDFVFDDRYIVNSNQTFQLENFVNVVTSPYWNTESGFVSPNNFSKLCGKLFCFWNKALEFSFC